MSDRSITPEEGTRIDPLVAILSELAQASIRQTEAIGMIAREVDAGIKSFAGSHGHRAAAEHTTLAALGRIERDQGLMRHELQGALRRLGPLELEVDSLRAELREPDRSGGGENGNGHGQDGQ